MIFGPEYPFRPESVAPGWNRIILFIAFAVALLIFFVLSGEADADGYHPTARPSQAPSPVISVASGGLPRQHGIYSWPPWQQAHQTGKH